MSSHSLRPDINAIIRTRFCQKLRQTVLLFNMFSVRRQPTIPLVVDWHLFTGTTSSSNRFNLAALLLRHLSSRCYESHHVTRASRSSMPTAHRTDRMPLFMMISRTSFRLYWRQRPILCSYVVISTSQDSTSPPSIRDSMT